MRITAFAFAVALGLGVASDLGCGRSSLLDDGSSAAGSGTPPDASGSLTLPATDGSGFHHEGEGPIDAGADLDGTIVAQDEGGESTSEDAPSPKVCNPTCPSGFMCLGGECVENTSVPCGPDNCNGCCFPGTTYTPMGSYGQCFLGSTNYHCGSGGMLCQGCSPAMNGGHCVADPGGGGHCEGIGTCNATNCAGCCAGDLCVVGTQNIACGIAGAACQDCTSDGGLCTDSLSNIYDGGPYRACGYGCLVTYPPYACDLYCPSATDCTENPG